ncbi:hypothetical protein PBY51_019851 [Eleginops maclovinus]|uniref:tRNA-binding domain-containing protein n=1 Tax=Eleginops maclovinus TaxID=56733 RepID=A0AAN7XKI1_ELEMC|nr:hypothetical protein PBY51_019851 [Eleginops maclovinus]
MNISQHARSFARSLFKMSSHNPLLRLEKRASEADQIIEYLKQQVLLLKEKAIVQASVREEKKLMVENTKLKNDIEDLKKQLLEKEKKRGVLAVPMPSGDNSHLLPPLLLLSRAPLQKMRVKRRSQRKNNEERKQRRSRQLPAKKTPSLYVEQVDVGEAVPRTVVSGLVKHIPLEQMQNRMAVLMCNLKPAKMRGVVSQAMVMCASSPDKVEILDPPSGAVPGDRVTFQAFPGDPDKELNPKKKVWEQIQPDLRTDDQCVATYKGSAFEVAGKGVCKAQTMSNSGIK